MFKDRMEKSVFPLRKGLAAAALALWFSISGMMPAALPGMSAADPVFAAAADETENGAGVKENEAGGEEAAGNEAAGNEASGRGASGSKGNLSRTTEEGFVVQIRDEEGLLTREEAEKLLDVMEETGHHTNVTFATYKEDVDTKTWVDRNYYQKGYFNPGGIVFVVDMYHRNLNLRFEGDVKKTLGYSAATSIEDNVYQYASKGDYATCATEVFRQIGSLYAGQKIAQPMKAVISLLLGLSLSMMLLFLYVRQSRKQKREMGTLLAGSIGAAALTASVSTRINRRERLSRGSSSGSGGGGGGGGGGGSSGGAGHGF